MPDAPTHLDQRRIRDARRHARARSREIDAERDAAVLVAFRAEIGTAVRSASPLLISLLAIEGMTLDDAVETLGPRPGWPARPRLSGLKAALPVSSHMFRHYMMARQSQFSSTGPTQITQHPLLSCRFDRAVGGHFTLNVVDHSLEIEARIGPVLIETRFGELSLELDFELPATVFAASVGRLLEEIVDHEGWRGRGWRIAATAQEEYPLGPRLIALTGSVDYRMPWAT
jgi:hypothetical protein